MLYVRLLVAIFATILMPIPPSLVAQEDDTAAAKSNNPLAVTWRAAQPVYLVGSPLLICCEYDNRKDILDSVTIANIPTGSMPTLTGPNSEPTPTRLNRGRESPFPRRGGRMPNWTQPNGRVSHYYDINLLFNIQRAGFYTLKANRSFAIPDISLTIVDFVDPQRFDVDGFCDDTQPIRSRDVLPVHYELIAGRATAEGAAEFWFVAVKNITVRWNPGFANQDPVSRAGQMALRVEPRTEVRQQVLDKRWQLWTLLAAGEKNALVVWRLDAGTIDVVVPWTNDSIEMSAGPEFQSEAKVVVAGIIGEPKLTTSSLRHAEGTFETYGVLQPAQEPPGMPQRGRGR